MTVLTLFLLMLVLAPIGVTYNVLYFIHQHLVVLSVIFFALALVAGLFIAKSESDPKLRYSLLAIPAILICPYCFFVRMLPSLVGAAGFADPIAPGIVFATMLISVAAGTVLQSLCYLFLKERPAVLPVTYITHGLAAWLICAL